MRNDQYKLNSHQRLLLSMLKDLDAVCRAEDIRYMLFAGTALGAVRHGGFIPWDDDLDILLPRGEYARLLDALQRRLDPEMYYVQRAFSPHWPMQFSKLRLNGTTCIERFRAKDPAMHQGVYIDIFPCDNLADGRVGRVLQFLAAKVVIAKALYARGYETSSLLKKSFMQLCRLLPLQPLRRCAERRGDADTRDMHTFFAGSSRYGKSVFPRAWLTETVPMPFEDGAFPVSKHYDALLRRLYGDYQTPLPPEARGQKVHAVILDLERPYTDYLEQQKTMRIDAYARSIR